MSRGSFLLLLAAAGGSFRHCELSTGVLACAPDGHPSPHQDPQIDSLRARSKRSITTTTTIHAQEHSNDVPIHSQREQHSDSYIMSSDAPEQQDATQPSSEPERHARVVTDAMPLDWTRVEPANTDGSNELTVRYPWDVADIDKEDTELIIVGTAGQKITKMGANLGDYCNPQLSQLILRSHLIRTMEGLSTFTQLELLELYDNMIEELQALNEGKGGAPGPTLRVLDMSYNVIRDMTPVQFCPNLRELCT